MSLAQLGQHFNSTVTSISERAIDLTSGTRDPTLPNITFTGSRQLQSNLATRFHLSRNNLSPTVGRARMRGKPTKLLRCNVTCLYKPVQKVSAPTILESNARHLGNAGLRKFTLQQSAEQFTSALVRMFPPLAGVDFSFGKIDRQKRLHHLSDDIKTPKDIKHQGILGRSALYIIPQVEIFEVQEREESLNCSTEEGTTSSNRGTQSPSSDRVAVPEREESSNQVPEDDFETTCTSSNSGTQRPSTGRVAGFSTVQESVNSSSEDDFETTSSSIGTRRPSSGRAAGLSTVSMSEATTGSVTGVHMTARTTATTSTRSRRNRTTVQEREESSNRSSEDDFETTSSNTGTQRPSSGRAAGLSTVSISETTTGSVTGVRVTARTTATTSSRSRRNRTTIQNYSGHSERRPNRRAAALAARDNITVFARTLSGFSRSNNQHMRGEGSNATTTRVYSVPEATRAITSASNDHQQSQRNQVINREHLGSPPLVDLTEDPEVFEFIDSEDEALQTAIDRSLEDQSYVRPTHEDPADLDSLLGEFQLRVKSDRQELIVSRRHVLASAFRAFRRPSFDPTCNLYVKFSGEKGEDYGGPRREFFRLALHELVSSDLFEGKEGGKRFFTHNIVKLHEGDYNLAGKLVALSISQDGPGLQVLNSSLFRLMVGAEVDFAGFDLDLLPDFDTAAILKELRDMDNVQKKDNFLSQHGDWMLENGFLNTWSLKVSDRYSAFFHMLKQFIFYRTAAEIHQFCDGMNSVNGLWTMVQAHPKPWEPIFCFQPAPLTKAAFLDLYSIEWSETGSNKRLMEEETVYSFEIFLQDVEEKTVSASLEEILVFITGANQIPPGGFPGNITIKFFDVEPNITRYPFSSTCACTFSLPRGIGDPDELKCIILKALKESQGFGKC